MDVLAHHDAVNCKLTVLYILSKLVTVTGRNKLIIPFCWYVFIELQTQKSLKISIVLFHTTDRTESHFIKRKKKS